jgi:hypothetical protein
MEMSASGRSFKLKLKNGSVFYVSVKNTLDVMDRHKKNVTIVKRVGKQRSRIAGSHVS